MKTFKLDPGRFKEANRRNSIILLPFCLTLGIALVLITWNFYAFIIIPIFLFSAILGFYRGGKRIRESFTSFELTIDDEKISRAFKDLPTITIYKNDVRKITDYSNGSLAIETGHRAHKIIIPKYIQEKEEILRSLANFGQIKKKKRNTGILIFYYMIFALGLALFVLFLASKDRIVAVSLGPILVAGLLWLIIGIRKSNNLDNKAKKIVFIFIPLIILIVLRVIISLIILAFE
jgi:hypothetical protein